jgi:quercetin dioxygenase-like cupin family protein
MSETKRTQHFRSMEGKAYQLGPLKMALKRSDGEEEGSYSIFESLEPPGASVALHRHPSWQETFIVLDGHFEFDVAGERRSLGPGEMLVIPRSVDGALDRDSVHAANSSSHASVETTTSIGVTLSSLHVRRRGRHGAGCRTSTDRTRVIQVTYTSAATRPRFFWQGRVRRITSPSFSEGGCS